MSDALFPRTLGAFGLPGGWEAIVILLVVLIFFGNRIPGMARSLGSGINEFKTGLKEGQSGNDDEKDPDKLGSGKSGGEGS